MAAEFRLPVKKQYFAYNPGAALVRETGRPEDFHVPIFNMLRGLNYLRDVLPSSVPLSDILLEKKVDDRLIKEGEVVMAQNVIKLFGLDSSTSFETATQFIKKQLTTANEVTEFIRTTLNISEGKLNDEVSADPQLLRTIVRHLRKTGKNIENEQKPVEPKVSYELRRQLLLAVISGQLHVNTAKNKPYEMRSEVQNVLNDGFYTDERIGKTTLREFATTHDADTNEILEYTELTSNDQLDQSNRKKVSMNFRHAPLLNGETVEVYTNDRKKRDVESIIKSITRVKQGNIDPTKEIEDSFGHRFVVNGNDVMRDAYMDSFVTYIQSKYPEATIVPDPPLELKPGEEFRGQSTMTDYNRVKIFFPDKTTPYEVICYSMKDFLNSKMHTGTANEKGIYDGYAHDIYSLRRIMKAAKILFPEDFYNYNAEELLAIAMQKKVEELKAAREIIYE